MSLWKIIIRILLWNIKSSNSISVIKYLHHLISAREKPRSKLLLHYFGEQKSNKCGKCDFCINEKRQKIKDSEYKEITNKLETILIDKELTIEEICVLMPNYHEQQLISIIQYLFDNDRLGKFGNKYQWKSNK